MTFFVFLFSMFSTREVAVLFWLTVLIIWILWHKEMRLSMVSVLKSLFAGKMFVAIVLMVAWTGAILYLLYKIRWWQTNLMKDTIIWWLSVAFILFLKTNRIRNRAFFLQFIKDSLKGTLLIEFVLNFYTFNIWIELLMFPLLVLIATTKSYAETKLIGRKNDGVIKVLNNTLAFLGLLMIGYSVFKTVTEYSMLFTSQTFVTLVMPLLLTVMFLPFVYMMALWINYETLFIDIDFMSNDKILKRRLKKAVLVKSRFNLDKVVQIGENIRKRDLYQTDSIDDYLNQLLKTK